MENKDEKVQENTSQKKESHFKKLEEIVDEIGEAESENIETDF